MSEYKNNKTRCIKKYAMEAKEVAAIAGCSESYVKQIRKGDVALTSPMAILVMEIDNTAKEARDIMIKGLERIVNK